MMRIETTVDFLRRQIAYGGALQVDRSPRAGTTKRLKAVVVVSDRFESTAFYAWCSCDEAYSLLEAAHDY